MIKIQLCPPEELDNPLWWLSDVSVAVVVLIAAYLGANWYLGTIQQEIDVVEASTQSLKDSSAKLKPDLLRFKTLDTEIATLNKKLDALRKITVSKIARYKPLIALEHFQNLRPEGVWFRALKIGTNNADSFELVGQAFDNLIVAEFMTAIRATSSQDKDDGDLRTQVAFAEMNLSESVLSRNSNELGFSDLGDVDTFHLTGRIVDRTGGNLEKISPEGAAANAGSGSSSGPSSGSDSGSGSATKDKVPTVSLGPDHDDAVSF